MRGTGSAHSMQLAGATGAVARAVVLALVLASVGGLGAGGAARAAERRHVDARTGMLEVPVEELVAAVKRKDRAEIGRVSERIGPARLVEALHRSEPAVVQATLTGILAIPGRLRLLGPVSDVVATGEPGVAAAAARTVGEMLATAGVAELDEWDVPADVLHAACVALRAAAILPANPTPLRLAALDGLADGSAWCPVTPELGALARDPTPAVRRAFALVVRPQQRLATAGFAVGTRDTDASVATASVAAVCEALAEAGTPHASGREPVASEVRQAARRMVMASGTPADDGVEMLDCLDPSSKDDRQLLEGLRARHRTPLGERAAEILDQAQAAAGRARP